jgi:hypothetical protein
MQNAKLKMQNQANAICNEKSYPNQSRQVKRRAVLNFAFCIFNFALTFTFL